jgi:hypothetical protein
MSPTGFRPKKDCADDVQKLTTTDPNSRQRWHPNEQTRKFLKRNFNNKKENWSQTLMGAGTKIDWPTDRRW